MWHFWKFDFNIAFIDIFDNAYIILLQRLYLYCIWEFIKRKNISFSDYIFNFLFILKYIKVHSMVKTQVQYLVYKQSILLVLHSC